MGRRFVVVTVGPNASHAYQPESTGRLLQPEILLVSIGGRSALIFEQNFEDEMDEGIKRLITLFRLTPDQSALPAVEERWIKGAIKRPTSPSH
jgi:hypothetical protein